MTAAVTAARAAGGENAPRATKRLFANAGWLFIVQLANFVLPLILLPYLSQVLGVRTYGVVAFGLSMVTLSSVLTNFGFGLSATYDVARLRDDRTAVQRIVGAVLASQVALTVATLAITAVFVLVNVQYHAYQPFFWLLLLSIAAQAFQPVWLFQGIERMSLTALATLLSRVCYLAVILLLVHGPADYLWIAAANGGSFAIATGLSLALMVRLGYRPRWPGLRYTVDTFRRSTEYFWSRAAVSVYTVAGTFYLGLVGLPAQAAYYSVAQQLYNGAQYAVTPVSQALYPYMARERNFRLLFRVVWAAAAAGVLGIAVGAVLGRPVITLLFGERFAPSYDVLLVYLVVFAVTTPSTLLGYPFLGALGRNRIANVSVFVAGGLQVLLLLGLFLAGWAQAVQVALAVLTVEVVVLTIRIVLGRRALRAARQEPA